MHDIAALSYRREAAGTLLSVPSTADYHFGPAWLADLLDAFKDGHSLGDAVDIVLRTCDTSLHELLVGLHNLTELLYVDLERARLIRPLNEVLPEYSQRCGTFGMPL